MRCYLDDLEPKMLTIEDDVTISYGVFMACHGRNQHHKPITIKKGAYIGMRANIITKNDTGNGVTIGEGAIVGACALVNRDVPAGATAVGVPCRIIERKKDEGPRFDSNAVLQHGGIYCGQYQIGTCADLHEL